MKRACSNCLAKGKAVAAEYVATDAQGLQWFECGKHEPRDNLASTERTARQPIREWYAGFGVNFDEISDLDVDCPPTERRK
jgi:hypothetical protein